jgi:RimJ/RimL family protein N-acetyltransferase
MDSYKLLIDTHVFIALEDQAEVAPEVSGMVRTCEQHGVRLFVHSAAVDDIKRDRDEQRRRVSLSKIQKYSHLSGIQPPPRAELETRFGPISKSNDAVDVALLYALELGAVDFLVTQDHGIHTRARKRSASLADRVLTIPDTVVWLRATFEPTEVRLPQVQEVPAHAIPAGDEIFDSLRDGYPDFDRWWRQKCVAEHRLCWAVSIDGELAGLVVRKDETHNEAGTRNYGRRILKICTFEVKPKFRGEKLGELLLKQVLWFAQRNRYDLTYLTTFPNQATLIQVLEYFGFERTGKNDRGELVYEKQLSNGALIPTPGIELFELDRINYPRFAISAPAEIFCVPIRGEYHDILFPELISRPQANLFEAVGLNLPGAGPKAPGNTIRKVYLCRARTKALKASDVLLFYRSKSVESDCSQSLTSVGVVEAVHEATDLEGLVRLTGKRSVYSTGQLQEIISSSDEPVKVIDFLLVGHLEPAAGLVELRKDRVFAAHPPQSICHLSRDRVLPLTRYMQFGFGVAA